MLLLVDGLLERLFAETTLEGSFQQMFHSKVRAKRGFCRAFLAAVLAGDVFGHLLVAVQVLLHAVLVLNVMTAQVTLNFHNFLSVRVPDMVLEAGTCHQLLPADFA